MIRNINLYHIQRIHKIASCCQTTLKISDSQSVWKYNSTKCLSNLPAHIQVSLPTLSPKQKEVGALLKWEKKEGDLIKQGDIVVKIQTGKKVIGFQAIDTGYLAKIIIPEGTKSTTFGQLLCIMVENKTDIAAFESYSSEASTSGTSVPVITVPHTKLPLPLLSPTMPVGAIIKWEKKEGDLIKDGDVLVQIETDEKVVAYEAADDGYLAKIIIPEGSKNVSVGRPMCILVKNQADIAAFQNYTLNTDTSEKVPIVTIPHSKLRLPLLSPTMEVGSIIKWEKKEGDLIKNGDVLVQIETDEKVVAYEAADDGYLAKIIIPEGSKNIPVGQLMCITVKNQADIATFKTYLPRPFVTSTADPTNISALLSVIHTTARAIPAVSLAAPGAAATIKVPHTQVFLPLLTRNMEIGAPLHWKKKEGDLIKKGDIITEIKSGKRTIIFEAADNGYLAKIIIPEGTDIIPKGQLLCIIVKNQTDIFAFKNYSPSVVPVVKQPLVIRQAVLAPTVAKIISIPHTQVSFPSLMSNIEPGAVLKWEKEKGDFIKAGDIMVRIITDKKIMEFQAADEGYLAKICIPEGSNTIPVGQLLCITVKNRPDVASFKNYLPKLSITSAGTQAASKVTEAIPTAPKEIRSASKKTSTIKLETSAASTIVTIPHTQVSLPLLSTKMTVGARLQWKKKEGDLVKEGDIIAQIKIGKDTVCFEAADEGYIAKIILPEGTSIIPMGQMLCITVKNQAHIPAFLNNSIRQTIVPQMITRTLPASSARKQATPVITVPHTKLPMPLLSPTMKVGRVVKWEKKEGDLVKEGDVLVQIEADNTLVAYEAVDNGYIAKIVIPEGTRNIPVGQLLGIMVKNLADIANFKSYLSRATTILTAGPSITIPHTKIPLPLLSPTMEVGSLVKWEKKEGELVKKGDVLVQIKTDKKIVAYEAVDDGYLAKVFVPEGTINIPVGQLLCIMVKSQTDIATFKNYLPETNISRGSFTEVN